MFQYIPEYKPPRKFGGLTDSLINAGVQITGLLASQSAGGPKASGPAKGLAAITAFCQSVLSSLNQILQNAGSIDKVQAVSLAEQLISSLSNPAQVYQAKSGEDHRVLETSKIQATMLLEKIKAAFYPNTTIPQTVITGYDASDKPITVPDYINVPINTGIAGIDPKYLVYGAIGLAALFLIKK